jgi:Na+-translocating ferredoxin:NAD+ oxidoreductase subunit A
VQVLSISSIFLLLISAILVNNFILARFLGICPFLGVSKQVETAFGMGMAVTFVMALAAIITFLVQKYILVALGLEYMQTIAFILLCFFGSAGRNDYTKIKSYSVSVIRKYIYH